MNFDLSGRQTHWRERVIEFLKRYVEPAVPINHRQENEGERWDVIPVLEELKKQARVEGLWNMFMPSSHEDEEFLGAGPSGRHSGDRAAGVMRHTPL